MRSWKELLDLSFAMAELEADDVTSVLVMVNLTVVKFTCKQSPLGWYLKDRKNA